MVEMTPADVVRAHDAGRPLLLLDVREPDEIAAAAIPWATAIPMMEIPQRFAELPADRPIAVLCHSGFRSARVTEFLSAQGYDARNVAGGIDAWSDLDRSIPRY